MYRKSEKNMVFGILALLVAVSAITLAYAGFTQTLTINGGASVKSSKWDIHFENLSSPSLAKTAAVITAPTIQSGTTIGNYSVRLMTPGDSVSYTFEVVNDGDFNAELSTLTKNNPSCSGGNSTNVCNNLTYTLVYNSNNAVVSQGDTLNVGERKKMKLTLTYNNSNNTSVLATSDITVSNLGITLLYSQSSLFTIAPVASANYVYTISTTHYQIGDAAPALEAGTTVSSEEAIVSLIQTKGYYAFLRHTVDGSGNTTESYVGFTNNARTTVYYLKGYDTSAYSDNQAVITAYNNAGGGSANPSVDGGGSGDVSAGGLTSFRCYVSSAGGSICYKYESGSPIPF